LPISRLFSLCILWKLQSWNVFSTKFRQKLVGLHFGLFFYKLILSHWIWFWFFPFKTEVVKRNRWGMRKTSNYEESRFFTWKNRFNRLRTMKKSIFTWKTCFNQFTTMKK
jgi:hypothetical protein